MAQMTATSLTVNGKRQTVTAHPDTPLLWVLREHLKLTGTKFGCGVGQCGACTVHIDGEPTFSCLRPISTLEGARVTTIEGLVGGLRATRCRKRGSPSRRRSAATASPGRSCARLRCSRRTLTPRGSRSLSI